MKNIQLMGSPAKSLQLAIVEAIVSSPAKISQYEKMGHGEEIYTTPECLKDVYELVWANSRKGRKLTELDRMFQKEFVAFVFAGAGLRYKGYGARSSAIAADDYEYEFATPESIRVPELLEEYVMHQGEHSAFSSPVAGYGQPFVNFITPPMHDAEFYSYAIKSKELLERLIKKSSGEDKAHYELLLRNIQRTLK